MLEKMNIDTLSDIASIQGAIVGAALALIIFSAQLASTKYNRRILQDFKRDTFTMLYFASLLGSIGVTTIARFANIQGVVFLGALLFWYIGNIVFLWPFVRHIITLMDPKEIANRQIEKAEKAFRKDNLGEFLERFATLGDIHYLLLKENRDISIVKDFVDYEKDGAIDKRFAAWLDRLKKDSKPPDWHEYAGAAGGYLEKVYFGSEESRNSEIERLASGSLVISVMLVCREENQEQAIESLLRAIWHLAIDAMRKDKVSGFILGGAWYRDVIDQYAYPMSTIKGLNLRYLQILDDYFLRINRLIIDEGKYDIFSEVVGYVVNWVFGRVILDHYKLIEFEYHEPTKLQEIMDSKYQDMLCKLTSSPFLCDVEICNITEDLIEEFAVEVEKRLKKNEYKKDIVKRKEELLDELKNLFLQTRVRNIFFVIGAYCVYRRRFDYIKEIWEYKQPSDAVATYVGFDLVDFNLDELYLRYDHLYDQTSVTSEMLRRPLDAHHDWEPYLTEYFVLCSLRAFQSGSTSYGIFNPVAHFLPENARLTHYSMLSKFCSYRIRNILATLEKMANTETLRLLGISEYSDQFKQLLEEAQKQARDTIVEYHETWPLDNQAIAGFKSDLVAAYSECPKPMDFLPVIRGTEPSPAVTAKEEFCQDFTLDRGSFVRGIGAHLRPRVNHETGLIASAQIDYVAQRIFESVTTYHDAESGSSFETLKAAIEDMKKQDYSPKVLLSPRRAFWDNYVVMTQNVRWDSGSPFLRVGDLELRTVYLREPKGDLLAAIDPDRIGEWLICTDFTVEGPEETKSGEGKSVLLFRLRAEAGFVLKDSSAAVVIKLQAKGEGVE